MAEKKSGMRTLIIVVCALAAILFVVGIPACTYNNKFVDMSEDVDQSWAEVQNSYQRRADLIPNLVSTVKGYSEHEQKTLQGVTDARARLDKAREAALASTPQAAPQSDAELQPYSQAQQNLKGAFDIYVNAVREAYPDLKANQNFIMLQDELSGTENRIKEARRQYTLKVAEYNKTVKKFPASMFAGMFGYDPRPQFQADADAQSAPKVDFEKQ